MTRVFITSMARTPFGKFQGALSDICTIELGRIAIDELLQRHGGGAAPGAVYGGSGLLGGSQLTVLRQMILNSGLHNHTFSVGVDRACCSGMTALAGAASWLRLGEGQVALAIGCDSLSNVPVLLNRADNRRINSFALTDPLLLSGSVSDKTIAQYTSEEALKIGVDRAMQDTWALRSHDRYFAGLEAGIQVGQLIPWADRPGALTRDESPRPTPDPEKLAQLRTVNGSKTITGGNAPGLSDGAAGVMLATNPGTGRDAAAELIDSVQVAGELQQGTSIPATAILKLLRRNDLALDDIDVIEINEAFAATPQVSARVLARETGQNAEAILEKVNMFGGSVALGHPLGASGIRIVMQAISILQQRGGGIAICAICGGFGQGEAVLIRL